MHRPYDDDYCAAYCPNLGGYSSMDATVIRQHMKRRKDAGVGVLLVSWRGQSGLENKISSQVLDRANEFGIKCAWMMEPAETPWRMLVTLLRQATRARFCGLLHVGTRCRARYHCSTSGRWECGQPRSGRLNWIPSAATGTTVSLWPTALTIITRQTAILMGSRQLPPRPGYCQLGFARELGAVEQQAIRSSGARNGIPANVASGEYYWIEPRNDGAVYDSEWATATSLAASVRSFATSASPHSTNGTSDADLAGTILKVDTREDIYRLLSKCPHKCTLTRRQAGRQFWSHPPAG